MGIFAPDAFPEWLRVVLFWMGAALAAVGVAAAAWHYRPKGWLKRHVWWRLKLNPPTISYSVVDGHFESVTKLSEPEAWVPLHEALTHLIYQSEWAHHQALPKSKEDFDKTVSGEFREYLARGDVRARGVKGTGFSDSGDPTEPIAADYWVKAFVSPYHSIALQDTGSDAAGNRLTHERATYRRVVINKNDLEGVRPKATRQSLSPLAEFVEPLRAKINAEKTETTGGLLSQDSFGYPYAKAVLKLRIQNPKGTRRGNAKGVPFAMSLAAQLQNDHGGDLKNCSVVLREITGLEGGSELTGAKFKIPKNGIVRKSPNIVSQFTMVRRDMSDRVTPEPFLLLVGDRTIPLSENSTYTLRLELMSESPHSTMCQVQINTGEGLDAEAIVIDHQVSARTAD